MRRARCAAWTPRGSATKRRARRRMRPRVRGRQLLRTQPRVAQVRRQPARRRARESLRQPDDGMTNPGSRLLRILNVEDNPGDAQLLSEAIRDSTSALAIDPA